MISSGFFKSSFIYTVIGALPLASQLLLLPFYTNYLSTHDFGLLAIYTSFSLLIQVFVNLGLDTTIGINYFDYKSETQKLERYIGTIATGLLLIGGMYMLLLAIGGPLLFSSIFDDKELTFYPYGFISVLTGIFNSFFKTYSNLLTNQQRAERFFRVNFIFFVLTTAISLVGIYIYPSTLIGPLGGRFVAAMIIFMVTLYSMHKEFGLSMDKPLLRTAIAFSFPIMLYNVMSWMLAFIDRYIIKYYMQSSDVGIYDFAVKCTVLIEFLQMGLGNSIFPKIYSIWKEKDINYGTPEVNKYYSAFTALTVIVVAITIIIIPLIVPVFVRKVEYYEAFIYTPIICLSFLFRGLFNMYLAPIYFFKLTKMLPRLYLFISIIQLGLEMVLIWKFGIWGAVWTSLIIKPVQVLILYSESKKVFRFEFNKMKLIGLPVIYSILVIVLEFTLGGVMHRLLLHTIELMIAIAAVSLLYMKELRQLLTTFVKPKHVS